MADLALVCGAGGALGNAIVSAFLERGDEVAAVDRSAAPRSDGARVEATDLTDPDEVEALWDRIGAVPRWVVNAAGGFRPGSIAESEPDSYRFVQDLNLGTAWWSCRAAARRVQPGGAIVNVAARSAIAGGVGSTAYAVAKAGVVRLTQVLALELDGVRANVILPTLIDTPANRASLTPEQLKDAVAPEQVAAVVAFLCSDAAAAVNGASIVL